MLGMLWSQDEGSQLMSATPSYKDFVGLGRTLEFTVGLVEALDSDLSSLHFALLTLYPSEGLKLLKLSLIPPFFSLTLMI